MKSLNIYIAIIFLFVKNCQSQYYCKTDQSIKDSITAIEKQYIGQGSFGKIYGNESFVSKTMKTDDSVSLQLLNNELKLMIAFNTEYDFTQLHPNNCWYKYNYRMYHYEVKAKMDRMASDMNAALKTSSLKSRSIWKIDMMFKILIGMKKMHDYNILHLDLKEANIMMMNEYTPVIADFGMALLDGESRNWAGGTPLFMAPEINSGRYGKGGDIFALGIIFFQLLNERFVNNQSFRKLCNRSESIYSNVYCLFDETIDSMMNRSSYQRPSVDKVIQEVLKVMRKYIESNKDSFVDYMNREKTTLNSRQANPATKAHLAQLNAKWEQRKEIYEQAANGASRSTLENLVNQYAKPDKDIKKFFRENSQRDGIVGKNNKQIKDQKELVDDEEDQQKSIRNIKQRMENAHNDRAQFLKGERFFRDDEIQDRIVDVPQVHLPKKAPSNNIEQRKRDILNQPRFRMDNNLQNAFDKPNNNRQQFHEPNRQFKNPHFQNRGISDPNQAFKKQADFGGGRFNVINRAPSNNFFDRVDQRKDNVGGLITGNGQVFNQHQRNPNGNQNRFNPDKVGGGDFIQRLEQQRNEHKKNQNQGRFNFGNRVFV